MVYVCTHSQFLQENAVAHDSLVLCFIKYILLRSIFERRALFLINYVNFLRTYGLLNFLFQIIIDKFKIKIACEVEQIKPFKHKQIRITSNVFVLAVGE